MKNILFAIFMVLTSVAYAQEVARIPVTETYLECQEQTNTTGAAVGAGAGYVAGRLLFGKGAGSLVGAATGAVVGSQVQKPKTCWNAQKTVGYRVMTKVGDKIVESYVPVNAK